MTLKELLKSCDFKDIASCIAKTSAGTVVLSQFKEAFDILRHLEPAGNGGRELEIVRAYDKYFKRYYPLLKQWGELREWKYELANKIIVSDELMLTDAEIAANILWELTYWGDQDTPENHDMAIKNMLGREEADTSNLSNPFALAAEKLERKLRNNYLPKQFKEYKDKISLPAEAWDKIERKRKNRPKRMRDHRQKKRIEALERMTKVEDAIRRLTANTCTKYEVRGTQSFSREELEYLFKTKLIHECPYHTRAYDVHQRVDYLIDLFSNYVSEDFSKYTRFLLMFRTSSDYPLAQSELERLENFFNQYLPASANIRYGYGNDETLGTEVSLLFVGSY